MRNSFIEYVLTDHESGNMPRPTATHRTKQAGPLPCSELILSWKRHILTHQLIVNTRNCDHVSTETYCEKAQYEMAQNNQKVTTADWISS